MSSKSRVADLSSLSVDALKSIKSISICEETMGHGIRITTENSVYQCLTEGSEILAAAELKFLLETGPESIPVKYADRLMVYKEEPGVVLSGTLDLVPADVPTIVYDYMYEKGFTYKDRDFSSTPTPPVGFYSYEEKGGVGTVELDLPKAGIKVSIPYEEFVRVSRNITVYDDFVRTLSTKKTTIDPDLEQKSFSSGELVSVQGEDYVVEEVVGDRVYILSEEGDTFVMGISELLHESAYSEMMTMLSDLGMDSLDSREKRSLISAISRIENEGVGFAECGGSKPRIREVLKEVGIGAYGVGQDILVEFLAKSKQLK